MPPEVLYDCPRCMAKGYVDQNDINRLGRTDVWAPGPCGYCAEKGKVNSAMLNHINPDDLQLVSSMTTQEREDYIHSSFTSTSHIPTPAYMPEINTQQPSGTKDILIGLGLIVLGAIITGVSYSTASNSPSGGHYVVTTGLFVLGVMRLINGLFN